MKKLLYLTLCLSILCIGAAPTRTNNFISGTTIRSDEVDTDFNDLYGYLQTGVDTIRTDGLDTITEIKSTLKSGSDATLITGTKGTTTGGLGYFDTNGDLLNSGATLVWDGTNLTFGAVHMTGLVATTSIQGNFAGLKSCDTIDTDANGYMSCGSDDGSGGGDSVTVNSTAVDTTANFKDTASVTWALTDGGSGGPDDAKATAILATTSTALAANGSNCSAANYPLGVDASGAVESCTAAVTSLDGLSDIGTSTPTDGYLLVADGDSWESTTETVAVITAGGFVSDSADSYFNVSRAADKGVPDEGDMWYLTTTDKMRMFNGTTTVNVVTSDIFDLDGLSDVNSSSDTAGYILIADGSGFDGIAVSGDIAIDGTGAATIQANSVDGTMIALIGDAQGNVTYYDGTYWTGLVAGTSGQYLKTQGAAANPVWSTLTGSEINVQLDIQSAKLPKSNPMGIDAGQLTWRGLFNDTTDEHALWQFALDDDYSSGTLYADIYYTMASDNSGNLVMTGTVAAVTSADAVYLDGTQYLFDSENSVTDAAPANVGNMKKATMTLTNADSAAGGDLILFQLGRDVANDTLTGDAEVLSVQIRE